MSYSRFLFVLLYPLASSMIFAADSEAVIGLFDTAIPQVVTPSKIAQSRAEVSSSLSILDREFIERSGVQHVEDLLQYVPGFFVAPFTSSDHKVVAYHGTQLDKYRRIQVLVNGRSVYSAGLSRVEWSNLPLNVEDIERIEVNRGPNAASYGANSFFAVVNIITRAPLDTLGSAVNLSVDDRGKYRTYAQYSDLQGDWGYRASVSKYQSPGFDIDSDGEERHDRNGATMGNLYLTKETGVNQFYIELGANRAIAQDDPVDYVLDSYETAVPEETSDRSYFLVGWKKQLSPQHEIRAQYYFEQTKKEEPHYVHLSQQFYGLLFSGAAGEDGIERRFVVDLEEQRQDAEIQSTLGLSSNLRLVSSASYRVDSVKSDTYLAQSQKDELFRLSSSIEYAPAPDWVLNSGAMLEWSKLSGTFLSPKLGITHLFSPSESVRLNYSEAVRTPDIFDQHAYWHYTLDDGETSTATYALDGEKEETIRSVEAGYFRHWPLYGLTVDLRLYHDQIRDLVVSNKVFEYPPVSDITDQVIDEGERIDLDISGLEAEMDWRSPGGTLTRLTGAYQNTETDNQDVEDASVPLSASLVVSYPWNETLALNSRFWYGQQLGGYDHQRLNAWLSWHIPLGQLQKADLGLGVEKRLDDNPYLVPDNRYDDDISAYFFANMTF